MNYINLESGFNLRKTLLITSIILVVGYGLFNARNIIIGPQITILAPQTNSETSESLATVEGIAKNVVLVTLNDRAIFIDQEGRFRERLLLAPGFNIIRLYGKDRFKQETTKEIKVYYKE